MLLFLVIALSIFWVCGCALGLALGAMLARADGRTPAMPARGRARAQQRTLPVRERMLPTA
ncbi:MAG: hypothetical protein QOG94_101 [Solirubrobacteraceae bacterium]|jgi:hypothetical protein|nr:hypothetical protein [Solirubrobacteraceae bacterium]MEA2139526.1 hypothetical protein [Solirubrobacteraceae bacterium]